MIWKKKKIGGVRGEMKVRKKDLMKFVPSPLPNRSGGPRDRTLFDTGHPRCTSPLEEVPCLGTRNFAACPPNRILNLFYENNRMDNYV